MQNIQKWHSRDFVIKTINWVSLSMCWRRDILNLSFSLNWKSQNDGMVHTFRFYCNDFGLQVLLWYSSEPNTTNINTNFLTKKDLSFSMKPQSKPTTRKLTRSASEYFWFVLIFRCISRNTYGCQSLTPIQLWF